MAWMNSIGNAGGFVGPLIALPARRYFGGWQPYMMWVSAGTLVNCALYWRFVSLRSARQLYDQMLASRSVEAEGPRA